MIRKVIFAIISLLCFTVEISAQKDAWPVQVRGSMLPPHSLNLKVYGLERSSDLSFQLLLKDPVEANLYVRPVISIEQNGTIIYQTDPNFAAEPILLSQFEQMLLSGSSLEKYLSNTALIGASANSTGSVDIPEGFNQICLQLYGVERNVPVSNKFCISGNFRLNQPPQIVKPAFNEKIKMPPVQNMIFSWQAMHLGSGNNPGPVEYTFELVELPMGVMNANDAFESSLRIYNTKTTATSLIYSPAEPKLDPNKYYAWRVTATSIMYTTSKLFQNDGKSEVSMFILYNGEAPAGDINPFDNPSPRGCSVYETAYGPVAKADNEPMIAAQNQVVKLGYFTMKLTEVNGSQQVGYSGKGLVEYPMLRSSVGVEFKNIKVNKEGRVYEAESIDAIIEPTLGLDPEQLERDVISVNLNNNYVQKLFKSITKTKKVALLSEGSVKQAKLPLALENKEFPDGMVCVTGIRFTPANAYLTMIGLEKTDAPSSKSVGAARFNISAATAIPATPYGLKNGAHLVPVSSNISSNEIRIIPSIYKSMSMDDDSRIICDCNGMNKKQTKENLFISPDLLVKSTGRPVKLPIRDNKQKLDGYSGELEEIGEFRIAGENDYLFNSVDGALNLDKSKKLNNLPAEISAGLSQGNQKAWLKNTTVTLPAQYSLGSSKDPVLSGDMIIGEGGIEYGSFVKNDLISIDKGKIEKWRYSVDEMRMTIDKGKPGDHFISGKVQLPVSSHDFNYTGQYRKVGNGNPVIRVDKFPQQLSVEMWKGTMDIDPSSVMTLAVKNINEEKTIYPTASISGDFAMRLDKNTFKNSVKGNIAQTLEDVKKVFDIKNDDIDFGVSGIKIQNWAFDPYAANENKYLPTNLNLDDAKFSIAGKNYPITDAEIFYKTDDKEQLGLSFTTVTGKNRISFTIWGMEKDGKFVFDGIEEVSHQMKCDCDSGNAIGMTGYDEIYDDIIRQKFMPHLSHKIRNGGTSSLPANLSVANAAVYLNWKKYLEDNTLDGFILKDANTLYWPLLEKNIEVISNDSKISSLKNFNLTADDFKKLGFKSDVRIPLYYEMVITGLTINKSEKEGKRATLKFKLQPLEKQSETFRSTFLFESAALPVSGTAIQIADVRLNHISGGTVNMSEGVMWGDKPFSNKYRSHATLDCTNGLGAIEIFGVLIPVENLDRISKKLMNASNDGKYFETGIPIKATIENVNGRTFENYIATCYNFIPGKEEKNWSFILKDNPHIIFKAGENYEIYYDHHALKDVPSFDALHHGIVSDGKSFQGLVFKKFAAEVAGFNTDNNKAIEVSLSNGILVGGQGEKQGFYVAETVTNVLDEKAGANFSGWKYTVDTLSFKVEGSVMTENVKFSGGMLIPIFKDKPVDFEKRKFDRGWAKFNGEILSDYGVMTSTLGFKNLTDQLFQSVLLPGMAMKLNESSVVKVTFDQKTQKWMPEGNFSGMCDFYLNDNVALSMNIISPPGLELEADPISFENLKVGVNAFDDAVKFSLEGNNISYVDLGKWGDVDTKDLAKSEELQDFRDRLDYVGGQKKSAGTSKAMPGDKSKAGSKGTFMGFDLKTTYLGPTQRNGEIVMGLKLAVGLMGATKEKTSEGTETKSQFIRTEGVLGLIYKPGAKSQDTWQFSSVTLECLSVEGALGPVSFAGGLNILRGDEEYGSGLKGQLSAEIEGLGGMNIVGQFGKKKDDAGDYYYGFLDLEVFSEAGIPLFYDPITNVPKIDFYGAGGGIQINMRTKKAIDEVKMPATRAEIAKKEQERKDAENRKANKNFCTDVGGELLQPGVGLNQAYTPMKGSYGGKIFVIFGPWSPVEPPYTILADAGIQIEMDWNNETNELSLGEMTISGRGYVMPVSIMERRDNNVGDIYAGLTLDWRNKYLEGEISFRSKFDLPIVGTTLFSMPVDYDKTVFATRANYNKGQLRFGFSPTDPYVELKLGGPGTGEMQPLSGKFFTGLSHTTIKTYAQVGANVDAPLKLEEMIPELKSIISEADKVKREGAIKEDRPKTKDLGSDQSKGIAFGLIMAQDINKNYLLLHADLALKLGFDVNLREYKDVECSNSKDGGQIGLKGWYAYGTAFAYAKGQIDMGFRLFGVDLTAAVFDASAYLTMELQGPNPSYFRGMIGGKYNVLDGAFSGDFQYKVILGEECEVAIPPDPIADIKIYESANIRDGQTNVDRYSDITFKTNIPLRKDYSLTQKDTKGKSSHAVNFMADVRKIKILKKGNEVNSVYTLRPDAKTLDISFDEALDPMTEYTIEYEFGWKVKEGSESSAIYTDRDKPEIGTFKFTTGARPTAITAGMIEYSAPGDRQRYWHKGYADTEIKFQLKALGDAVALFPSECKDCIAMEGTSGITKYKYIARLKEFNSNGAVASTQDFAITGYPGKGEQVNIQDQKVQSIGGKYNITYIEERSVPVSKVSFPDLKNFDLKKGMMYELSIIRELDIPLPAADNVRYKKVKKMKDDQSIVLKSYCFGTSLYESLNEKLANLDVRHTKSLVKMRDFSHPSDVYDSQRASVISQLGESKFHSVRDDYYRFIIKGRKGNEGFDRYDMLRIRRNLKHEYSQDYLPELRVTQLYKNQGMHPHLLSYLNSGKLAGTDYLKKVLFDHTKAEQSGMLDYGSNSKKSDGSKWHYKISGSGDAARNILSDQEISSKKMNNPANVYRSRLDPNTNSPVFGEDSEYDFLLQDLRSRIVINQLYWLSKLTDGVQAHNGTIQSIYFFYNGDYNIGKKGEFLSDDGRRDLSWITTPPDGISLKANSKDKAYIATEPGYRLSYHGTSTISFPTGSWGEMIESKRDNGDTMKSLVTFEPNRVPGYEVEINDVTELSLEEWYYISKVNDGRRISARHQWGNYINDVWGLEQPLFNNTSSSMYGIYTPSYGLIYDAGWSYIEELKGDGNSSLWKFSNQGKEISIVNKSFRDIRFPGVLSHSGFKEYFKPSFSGGLSQDDIKVKFTEQNSFIFSSEKKYKITDIEGREMKDNGKNEWRIYRDGRFYRIVSARGYALYAHRYDPVGPGDYWQVQLETGSFPSRGTNASSRDKYYLRLWNIVNIGNNQYVLNNAFKIKHHLSFHDEGGNIFTDDSRRTHLFEESISNRKSFKFIIEEIK